jgi:hypothetical protein
VHRSGLTTIVGLGIVTALFLAVMSIFYLQQIPTQADLDRLQDDLRVEHGLYLSAAAGMEVKLIRPEDDAERTGLEVVCTLRADIRRHPKTVELYLARIGDSILSHPDWRGKIGYVVISHAAKPVGSVTRRPARPKA